MTALTSLRAGGLAAAIALLATAGMAGEAPSPQDRLDSALADYERNHWQAAFYALAALADDGHAEAAQLALLMARHGPSLYRSNFAVPADRSQRWLAAALSHPALAPRLLADAKDPRQPAPLAMKEQP